MPTKEQLERLHREDLERLKGFCLMDDDFMTQCFADNNECVELVLQIILGIQDLKVVESRTQVFVENILKRSVRLDVVATDSSGRVMNIEIQRADRGAGRRRARYNSSMMDASLLRKGQDWDQLPETYTIFITERDVIGKGLPLYHVERCILETKDYFGDGTHIIYVNGAIRDNDTSLGRLMHDFRCTDPADMHYRVLADRVSFFKNSEKGGLIMSRVMEEMRNQARQEGIQEGIQKGIQEGIQKGIQEGIQKGIQEGIQMGSRDTAIAAARRMLADRSISIEKIAEFLGIPLAEIMKIGQPEIGGTKLS